MDKKMDRRTDRQIYGLVYCSDNENFLFFFFILNKFNIKAYKGKEQQAHVGAYTTSNINQQQTLGQQVLHISFPMIIRGDKCTYIYVPMYV